MPVAGSFQTNDARRYVVPRSKEWELPCCRASQRPAGEDAGGPSIACVFVSILLYIGSGFEDHLGNRVRLGNLGRMTR